MTETQRRIEAYQKALPDIKEKVVAVAMLLALSVIMLTSASFAWLTISRAPEVTAVSTNVAANGNLEIALAKPDGTEPGESQVGDSFSAEGQTTVNANITWGNLINLNDSSYGISKIVLRPAQIGSSMNLLERPLEGANYGDDGRLDKYYNEDFQFTSWAINPTTNEGRFDYFEVPRYGVRAISTVEYQYTQDDLPLFLVMMEETNVKLSDTNTKYQAVVGNDVYIDALAGLMGDYLNDSVLGDGTGNIDITKYMPDLYAMFEEFYYSILDFENPLVALANAQIYQNKGVDEYLTYTYKDSDTVTAAQDLLDDTDAQLANRGVSFTASVKEYKRIEEAVRELLYGDGIYWGTAAYEEEEKTPDCFKDYYLLALGKDGTYNTNDDGVVLYNDVENDYINALVKISSCRIKSNKAGVNATVAQTGFNVAKDLMGKDDIEAIIQEGLIRDFENLSGCKMNATDVTIKVSFLSVTAQSIRTSAPVVGGIFDTDCTSIEEAAMANAKYTATSMETYGMAIDYWVRTNASDSYIVLEGGPEIQEDKVRETSHDSNGNVVELWTVTVTTPGAEGSESIVNEVPIYIVKENGTDQYYRASNNLPLVLQEGETMSAPEERYKNIVTVIGYEGENRVWGDDPLIEVNSTTQGGGSCYTFYAEDPAQQDYCLRLLSNLRIAFIDANTDSPTYGKKVAAAKLDIDMRYEVGGKVTIPIILINDRSDDIITTPVTEDGLAIYNLKQNEPAMLTTVVYLDGNELSNAEVLATEDIQGQLNLQFTTTEVLTPIKDEKLQLETREVSVLAKKTSDANYPASNGTINFDFEGTEDMSIDLQLKVDGSEPKTVSAFFMREVNQWQGSKEETIVFLKNEEDGNWYCTNYKFENPGKYIMRTVIIDGVDYDLSKSPATEKVGYPTVEISGFRISEFDLYHNGNTVIDKEYSVMSDRSSVKMDVRMKFGTTKQPGSVRVQFVEEDGRNVFAVLSSTPDGIWEGSATFTLSGTYTMEKVEIDGEYFQLDPQECRTLTFYLGMRAEVKRLGGAVPGSTPFTGREEVRFGVKIFDNTDEEVKYLSDVGLIYGRSATDSFKTSLTWNGTAGQYEGIYPIKSPGVWKFIGVSIGQSSTISLTTNTPPEFTRISLDPVDWVENAVPMKDYYIDLSADETGNLIGVKFENAEAATVILELLNEHDNKTYTITKSGVTAPSGSNVSTYMFDLRQAKPTDGGEATTIVKEKGLGKWTVQKVSLYNVSKGTGDNVKFYTADDPLVYENEVKGIGTELVSINVKVANNQSGTDVEEKTELKTETAFMSKEKAANPIIIKITDHRGNALKATIDAVALNLKYAPGSSEIYGGYSFANKTEEPGSIPLSVTAIEGEQNTFTAEVELDVAGEYAADILSFNLTEEDGKERPIQYISEATKGENNLTAIKMPVYIRQTTKPTLSISKISPVGSHKTVSAAESTVTVTSKIEGNTITIYPNSEVTGSGCNKSGKLNEEPKVYLNFNNMGNAETAALIFTESAGGAVRLYYGTSSKNGTQTDAFTWNNGDSIEVMRFVGYNDAGNCDDSESAGTLTSSNKLELTHNGITYYVTVQVITIINVRP